MIKKLIKKLIMWECKEFELTPAEVLKNNLIAFVAVTLMALSIKPFFETIAEIIELI